MTGKEIRELREKMGLGRTAFGALFDTSREIIRSWEIEARHPNAENEKRLMEIKEENK
jgi:DNA-binding transcriptional regulator YiaG